MAMNGRVVDYYDMTDDPGGEFAWTPPRPVGAGFRTAQDGARAIDKDAARPVETPPPPGAISPPPPARALVSPDAGAIPGKTGTVVDRFPDMPAAPPAAPTASPTPAAPTYAGGGFVGDLINSTTSRAAQPQSLTMAELQPANERFSTPYFAAYTNSGDLAAAVPGVLNDTQRVRLVDPKTGEVLVEGRGVQGAQQIVTLANAISQDLGRKAAWQIQAEMQPDQFTTVGYDRADPKHDLLKTIVQIAGPLLGAAIPGMWPVLGAALGGFGSTLATGGSLKQSLLSGATSALGNFAGGGVSSLLRGAPVAWTGVNPLGGLLSTAAHSAGSLAGSLPGLTSGAGASAAGGALGNAALDAAANEIAPVIVTPTLTGGVSSLLGGAAGSALGSLVGNSLTRTPTSSTSPNGSTEPPEVATVDVMGQLNPTGVPVVPPPSSALDGATSGGSGSDNHGITGHDVRDFALDTLGQTIGGVGADLGVFGLTQLLGGGASGVNPEGVKTISTPAFDGSTDTGGQPGTPPLDAVTPPASTGGGPGANVGAGSVTPIGQGGGYNGAPGGALGQALAANIGSSSGGMGAPLAPTPGYDIRGSMAPDVWPWRRRSAALSGSVV